MIGMDARLGDHQTKDPASAGLFIRSLKSAASSEQRPSGTGLAGAGASTPLVRPSQNAVVAVAVTARTRQWMLCVLIR